MRYLLLFLFLPQRVFASNATDVEIYGLNGPVKCYVNGKIKLCFNQDGYLFFAINAVTSGVCFSWNEYYKHSFDKKGKRTKTIVYYDSLFTRKRDRISYKYDKAGRLVDVISKNYKPEKDNDCYGADIYKKYGKKSSTKNSTSVIKKKDHIVRCQYDENGNLCRYQADYYDVKFEYVFQNDTLLSNKIFRNDTLFFTESWTYNKEGKITAYCMGCDSCTKNFAREKYSYNISGKLIEKQILHKNYFNGITNSTQDCVVTYIYDEWNNLIAEEWRNRDGHLILKEYTIEYY